MESESITAHTLSQNSADSQLTMNGLLTQVNWFKNSNGLKSVAQSPHTSTQLTLMGISSTYTNQCLHWLGAKVTLKSELVPVRISHSKHTHSWGISSTASSALQYTALTASVLQHHLQVYFGNDCLLHIWHVLWTWIDYCQTVCQLSWPTLFITQLDKDAHT